MKTKPNCFKRKCKHYLGVVLPDSDGSPIRYFCKAYPNKIPDEIAFGNDLHLTKRKDQEGEFIFIKGNPKPTTFKKVEPYEINENGEKVFNIGADLASADPFVYGRLMRKAREGDEEAKKKMKEMENTDMYYVVEDE